MKIYKQETVQHVNAVEEMLDFLKKSKNYTRRNGFSNHWLIKINVSWPNYYKVTPLFDIDSSKGK
jgi:hypothetical protein